MSGNAKGESLIGEALNADAVDLASSGARIRLSREIAVGIIIPI